MEQGPLESSASVHRPLPTPSEMIAHLDRFVRGQERAKRDLATAFYTHCLARAACNNPSSPFRDFGKQHVLMLGPTGSGKSYVVRTLARFLDVPFAYVSATSLSEVGYAGDKVESCIERLIDSANGDALLAQRGFVFVDEVDKLRRPPVVTQRDVSGIGVQNALLTMLDGRTIKHRDTVVDSGDVLFVFAGAFAGMEEILTARHALGKKVGFGNPLDRTSIRPSLGDLYRMVTREDLEEFGFIPELIGRFATISVLDALTERDLAGILLDTEDSIIRKQKRYFELHGIELEFTSEAITALTRRAIERNTGARGVNSEVLLALDDVDYRPLELHEDGVVRIVVDVPTVLTGEPPQLVRDKGVAAARAIPAVEMRKGALGPARAHATGVGGHTTAFTDTRGWSDTEIRESLERIKVQIEWSETTPSARMWWTKIESENQQRPGFVLRLAEELRNRKTTIQKFFLAYVHSNTESVMGNLHYFDYITAKKKHEEHKQKAKADTKPEDQPG